MKTIEQLIEEVRADKPRGQFAKGVKAYALEMLEREYIDHAADVSTLTAGDLLNHVGGKNCKIGLFFSAPVYELCKECSWGGTFFIYNEDIAEALATPSAIKRLTRKDGTLAKPNAREKWLDTQARAVWCELRKIQFFAGRENYKGGEA